MFKKSHYITFGLVVLVALVLLNLPHSASQRLKVAIGGLFLPLFGLKSTAQQVLNPATDPNDPTRLLALQKHELEGLRRENENLRRQIGWQKQSPWRMKLAKVVLYEPANWWRTVQIDLGSRDGMKENLPVVTPEGLVGRISSVGLTTSKVVLVGDPSCRVSALVVEPRELGVIGSGGPLDRSIVEMNFISASANLKPGQIVTTSELGGVFRKGIPIGKIADAQAVEYGLYTRAHVQLAVNLSTLEEVWVLLP